MYVALPTVEVEVVRVELGHLPQPVDVGDDQLPALENHQILAAERLEGAVHVDRRHAHRVGEFRLRERQGELAAVREADRLQPQVEFAQRLRCGGGSKGRRMDAGYSLWNCKEKPGDSQARKPWIRADHFSGGGLHHSTGPPRKTSVRRSYGIERIIVQLV